MSNIDHLHSKTEIMQIDDHLNLLTAQYLIQRLDTENICHYITTIWSWKKRARRDPCKTTRPIYLVKLFTDSSNTANLWIIPQTMSAVHSQESFESNDCNIGERWRSIS